MTATMERSFTPIQLAELNETASLMCRVDRKYALGSTHAQAVVDALPDHMRILTIDAQQDFRYLSTYFDTPAWDAYLQAAQGRPHRFKVRVRHYDATSEAFLEVKTNEGGQTVKRRVPHDPRSLLSMHPNQHRFVHDCLARGRVSGISPAWLLPVLQTSYRRCTLLSPDATARVTMDSNLQWYAMDAGRVNAEGLVIIETKSAGPAHEIDRLLWSMGHRPTRISKYATGLAALCPDLPANRWHRTLHTHFA